MDIRKYIQSIADFPKPGIVFYDISPLLADGAAWSFTIKTLAEKIRALKPDVIVGIESRGFLLAAPLALELGIGFVMIRKSGKLPGNTVQRKYDLEYNSATLEIQSDAIKKSQRIVVVDDVLATGGTMQAAIRMLQDCGGDVVCATFLIELIKLGGANKLTCPKISFLEY